MILSHRHKYIFLHCRKTAGSSISVSLARTLGPDDLQLSGLKETHEAGIPYTRRVQQEARHLPDRHGWTKVEDLLHLWSLFGPDRRADRTRKLMHRRYRSTLGQYPYHARAALIAKAFPTEWAAYTKFCVVRNPWDKVVSDYYWRSRNTPEPPSFERFVKAMRDGDSLNGIVPGEPDNWPLYTLSDELAVDHVVRFENLIPDLKRVLTGIGLDWDGWLPRAKTRQTITQRPARGSAVYSPELTTIVAELFDKEASAFGYSGPTSKRV